MGTRAINRAGGERLASTTERASRPCPSRRGFGTRADSSTAVLEDTASSRAGLLRTRRARHTRCWRLPDSSQTWPEGTSKLSRVRRCGRQRHAAGSGTAPAAPPPSATSTSWKASMPYEFQTLNASPSPAPILHVCHLFISTGFCHKCPRPEAFVTVSIFCSLLFCFTARATQSQNTSLCSPCTKVPFSHAL